MPALPSPGSRFRNALEIENPLQIVGTINAYHARLADAVGYNAIYISGGGVAAGSCGIPDLGITTMEDVLIDLERITHVTDKPVMVDIDTGWGGAFNIARTVKSMIRSGAACVHMEDQVAEKRCGHRPGKAIVSTGEMQDRIKAAVDARTDDSFVLMARTDSLANEGLQASIDRACAYVEAGADMIFPEAMTELQMYRQFKDSVEVPILANITEFGKTPLFSTTELGSVGVDMVLYPLSAFRSMNAAALNTYKVLRQEGTQKNVVDTMQSRDELYDYLGYHEYEQKLDELFKGEK